MAEGRKISFGFSKSIKKSALQNVPPAEPKKIDYIECVDEKAIKIVGCDEKIDEPLIIPMLGSKTWHDRIVNKVDADIFEPKQVELPIEKEIIQDAQIKQEKIDSSLSGDITNKHLSQVMDVTEIKSEPDVDKVFDLQEQAAKEIIADLKANDQDNKELKVFAVPIANDDLKGKEESTLEDYENVPIDAFGMAMLRGMGWQPGKGIGKNEKICPPAIPELRPKGMGLGADKLVIKKLKNKSNEEELELKLIKGGYARIVAGKHSGSYGKIEGFDEDAARIILKLAIGEEVVSINEFWIEPVSLTEYIQKSKVINAKTFEEYKNNEKNNSDFIKNKSTDNRESSDDYHRDRYVEKSSTNLKKRVHSYAEDESSAEKKSRRRRDRSNNSDEGDKKLKKSKKHKTRDSSSKRSNRKSRKKDKESRKIKNKKTDYSDSSKKHKKERRSRSRSYSPKNRTRSKSRSYSPRYKRKIRSPSSSSSS